MDREIPFRFEVTNSASELLSEHSGLSEGESSGVTVSVAGRLIEPLFTSPIIEGFDCSHSVIRFGEKYSRL